MAGQVATTTPSRDACQMTGTPKRRAPNNEKHRVFHRLSPKSSKKHCVFFYFVNLFVNGGSQSVRRQWRGHLTGDTSQFELPPFFRQTSAAECTPKFGHQFSGSRPPAEKLKNTMFFIQTWRKPLKTLSKTVFSNCLEVCI